MIRYLDLFTTEKTSPSTLRLSNCNDSFISITGFQHLCKMTSSNSTLNADAANITLMMKTGNQAGGKGFRVDVKSVVKLPGRPRDVTLHTSDHAVTLSWKPPTEMTIPITAYLIRYNVVSEMISFLVTVGAKMRQYSVNTDNYAGKLMTFNITSLIGRLRGKTSSSIFVRARMYLFYIYLFYVAFHYYLFSVLLFLLLFYYAAVVVIVVVAFVIVVIIII